MFGCNKIASCGFAMVLMLVPVQLNAAKNKNVVKQNIDQNFEQGIGYFKQGNYSGAVKKFEQVRKQGNQSAALYYNLGSAYFKLGKYKNSKTYFKVLKKTPKMKSLAEYNLGLIALRQKDFTTAKKYFKVVMKSNQNKKLIYLAKQQLHIIELKKPVKKSLSLREKSSVYLSGGFGYDNNINFAPIDTGSEASGSFFNALISADYLLSGNHSNGWSAEALLYTIRYGSTTGELAIPKGAFDQDEYGISLKKTQKLSGWDTHIKMSIDELTYGSRDYQSILKLEARGRRKLSKTDRFYLRYRYEDISSDTFGYTEGWRQKIRAEFRRYEKNQYLRFYYELEFNDRNDLVLDDGNGNISEFSYSPTRHTLRGKYTTKLNSVWDISGDLSYRKSDYPSTLTQARNDDRWKAIVSAKYQFDKTLKLKLKLEYTDNASSDNVYVYDRQLVMLSLNKLF